MEIELRNNSSQLMMLEFEDQSEYELQPGEILVLPFVPGAQVEAQEDKIVIGGVTSPIETDTDDEEFMPEEE